MSQISRPKVEQAPASPEYLAAIAYSTAKKAAKENGLEDLWKQTESTVGVLVGGRGLGKQLTYEMQVNVMPRVIPATVSSATWNAQHSRTLKAVLRTIESELDQLLDRLTDKTFEYYAQYVSRYAPGKRQKIVGIPTDPNRRHAKHIRVHRSLGSVKDACGSITATELSLVRSLRQRGWRFCPPSECRDAIVELDASDIEAVVEAVDAEDRANGVSVELVDAIT